MKINSFRQLVRELIEAELDEVSGTGAAPGYQTPYAFQGGEEKNKTKRKKTATQNGFQIIDKDPNPVRGKLT